MPLLQMVPLAMHLFMMLILSIYASHAYVMLFVYHRSRRRSPESPPLEPSIWPLVTIQLPLFNEKYVVARLVDAVCQVDYPAACLEIQILDDSTDETRALAQNLTDQWRARGVDITYLHRSDRTGYKAGALKAGLAVAKGEFLAIFDADFVPPVDFLRRMMPHFDAPDIGVVQSRWGHMNDRTNALTRSLAVGLDAHFSIEHTARKASGLFINFNGTAGVWRKQAIVQAGNWQADTLTEDLDISYRAQMCGWRFLYVDDVVCPAEIPADVAGLKSQQYRWSKGAIQTARKILPSLWRQPDLPLKVKLEGTIHLTHCIVFPVMLVLSILTGPLMFLQIEVPNSHPYFLWASVFLIWSLSYPLFYGTAQRQIYPDWRRRLFHLPSLMAFAMGMSLVNTKAVMSGLMKRVSPFVRTPKYNLANGRSSSSCRQYQPRVDMTTAVELVMSVYLISALVYSALNGQYRFMPLILLPAWGFTWVGWLSLWSSLEWPRRRPELKTRWLIKDAGQSTGAALRLIVALVVPMILSGIMLWILVGQAEAQGGLPGPTNIADPLKEWPTCSELATAACYDFEDQGLKAWASPAWFANKEQYVSSELTYSAQHSTSGDKALQLQFRLPGEGWTATGINWTGPVDLDVYSALTVAIYLPQAVPGYRFSARVIIVAGDQWTWYEAGAETHLVPHQWVTLKAPLAKQLAGTADPNYWGDQAAGLVADQSRAQSIMIRIEASSDDSAIPTPVMAQVVVDHIQLKP